jgi:hypothetical protein
MQVKDIVIFKGFVIHNPKTGLYSRGGWNVQDIWSLTPKIWETFGDVKTHIKFVLDAGFNFVDETCYVHRIYIGCKVINVETNEILDFDPTEYYVKKKKESNALDPKLRGFNVKLITDFDTWNYQGIRYEGDPGIRKW